MPGIVALIPIRSFTEGKSRLAGAVGALDREQLIKRMFEHVVSAVRQSGVVDRIVVVSPDPAVLAAAAAIDSSILAVRQPHSQPGLNAAVALGREAAIRLRASAMLVLFGDLPVLQPDDVRSLVRRDAPVVIATDRHGAGTNALMLRLGSRAASQFTFHYGPNSRQRHLEEAERLGLDAVTAVASGTAIDLDTVDDIERLRAFGRDVPAWLGVLTDRIEEKSA